MFKISDRLKEEYLIRQAQLNNKSSPQSPSSSLVGPPPPTTPPSAQPPISKRTAPKPDNDNDSKPPVEQQQQQSPITPDQSKKQTVTESPSSLVIDELKSKINEYEQQNAALKTELDQMKTQYVNFSTKECETANEIQNLKLKIDQMMDKHVELSGKCIENEKKIKYFEQRDADQMNLIDKLKSEIDSLNKLTVKQDIYAKTFIENGQPIEIKQQQPASFVKSPLRSSLIINPNKPQIPLNNLIQDFNQHQKFAQELVICQQSDENANAMFGAVNRATPILDNEPSKFKSSLIKRGSLASRHLPHQPTHVDDPTTDTENLNGDVNGEDMDDESDEKITSESLDADDNTIYKLRILNGNQINHTANNYYMNNQTQMPLNAATEIAVTASSSMCTTTTSFSSTYANMAQNNQHTVSFTQPIEGNLRAKF